MALGLGQHEPPSITKTSLTVGYRVLGAPSLLDAPLHPTRPCTAHPEYARGAAGPSDAPLHTCTYMANGARGVAKGATALAAL